MKRVRLPDGTLWPVPEPGADSRDDESFRRACSSIYEAYHFLVWHPVGTEAAIKKLRWLRRAARKVAS